jgi:hypothetical protein
MGVLGFEESVIEVGFVAEEKEAFGVGIEPAQRVDIFGKTEFGQGSIRRSIGRELGENPVGLVKGEEHEQRNQAGFADEAEGGLTAKDLLSFSDPKRRWWK